MNREEFVTRAKTLGYSDDEIADIVALHGQAEKDGVIMDWEDDLIEKPIR